MIVNSSPKKSHKGETCPTCGQPLPAQKQAAAPSLNPAFHGEQSMAELAKHVTPEVMKIISPLVEKIQLAMQQQQEEMAKNAQAFQKEEGRFSTEVNEMQEAAMSKVKEMEQKIAQRMSQLQQRIGSIKKS